MQLGFARVLVDVSLKDLLPETISFLNEHDTLIHVSVDFEWKPIFCTGCHSFGHETEECRANEVRLPRRWVRKDTIRVNVSNGRASQVVSRVDADGFEQPRNPVRMDESSVSVTTLNNPFHAIIVS